MIYDAAAAAFITGGGVPSVFLGVRLDARNRSDQSLERLQVWTGIEDRALTVEGAARTYQGIGPILQFDPVTCEPGGNIAVDRISLSMSDPVTQQYLIGYDPDQAPMEIHALIFDKATMAYVGAARMVKGRLDRMPETRAAGGESWTVALQVESTTRRGTRTLATTKSDRSQRERDTADRGRRYADIADNVTVPWGVETAGGNYWIRPTDRAAARR